LKRSENQAKKPGFSRKCLKPGNTGLKSLEFQLIFEKRGKAGLKSLKSQLFFIKWRNVDKMTRILIIFGKKSKN
jgi:hypothetical protein